jgi:hypothetical protein
VMLALIDEAVASGARLRSACDVVNLSTRTVERWRVQDGGDDQQRGPITASAHKLSPAERKAVVAAANCAEFREESAANCADIGRPRRVHRVGVHLLSRASSRVSAHDRLRRAHSLRRETGQLAQPPGSKVRESSSRRRHDETALSPCALLRKCLPAHAPVCERLGLLVLTRAASQVSELRCTSWTAVSNVEVELCTRVSYGPL